MTIEDAGGNTVASSAPVTLAITTQPGSGAALTCTTNPLAATNGVATFAGCKIVGKSGSYTITATAPGLTGTTTTFTLNPGPATQLVFTVQPSGTTPHGAAWATQPVVTIEDSGGNTVASAPVTLAIATQPGSGAADLHHQPAGGNQRGGHLRRLQPHRRDGRHLPDSGCGKRLHRSQQPVYRMSRMAAAPHPGRDERGTTLVLAIVFVFITATILVAVGGLAANALLNSSTARVQRTTTEDAATAVTVAMQYLRYNPVLGPTQPTSAIAFSVLPAPQQYHPVVRFSFCQQSGAGLLHPAARQHGDPQSTDPGRRHVRRLLSLGYLNLPRHLYDRQRHGGAARRGDLRRPHHSGRRWLLCPRALSASGGRAGDNHLRCRDVPGHLGRHRGQQLVAQSTSVGQAL